MLKKNGMLFLILCLGITLCSTGVRADVPLYSCDVVIDAGHGGIDGGTSNGDIKEKDINLQMAKILFQQLSRHGLSVVLNRGDDYALSDDNHWHKSRSRHRRDLAQRKQLTHEISTKILISLHANWSGNSSVYGPLVLYQPHRKRSRLLASMIQGKLNEYYHTTRLAKPGKPFFLLKHAKSPAVIVETGYLSHPDDLAKLTNRKSQQEIAVAITRAVLSYWSLFEM